MPFLKNNLLALGALFCTLLISTHFSSAADNTPNKTSALLSRISAPTTPDPMANPVLANIVKMGTKVYYIGTRSGLDGWFMLKDGRVQLMYTTSDKKVALVGALFGEDGENISSAQVKTLLENNQEVASLMASAVREQQGLSPTGATTLSPAVVPGAAAGTSPPAVLSPGERLYQELSATLGVTLGKGTPKLLMVMDTNCPHCQATWRVLRDAVLKNSIQLRLIPIAPPDSDSERAEAVLLHSPDPLSAWDKYVGPDKDKGDKSQLAGTPEPALVMGIRANHTLIDNWHIDQTPYLVYRSKDGKVKVVVGEPEKVASILSDLVP